MVDPTLTTPDLVQTARAAGLRYVRDSMLGIRRRRRGSGWTYLDPAGKAIRDARERIRIQSLAIPPAWTDVWICPRPNGHLQATGRDARRRKQYRYHPDWRQARNETKFDRMITFAETLPSIRERVEGDLGRPGLPREKVLAAVVKLLDETLIRVGNDEYARQNGSYGLTTLRSEHVDVSGATIRFNFRGKSGVRHRVDVRDRRLARIVQRCQELPGEELFEYLDENGESRGVGSEDVNDYLREVAGQDFTAKDFRTWGGTVLAFFALARMDRFHSAEEAMRNVVEAVKQVAHALRNRPATCRKFYIHPAVVAAYGEGKLFKAGRKAMAAASDEAASLQELESRVVALLKETRG